MQYEVTGAERWKFNGTVAASCARMLRSSLSVVSIALTLQTTLPAQAAETVSPPDDSVIVRQAILRSQQTGSWMIVIDKSERLLTVYHLGEIDTSLAAEFGRGRRLGDKERSGDWKTPEGEFRVCRRNLNSQFYRALLLNYPLFEDAERGLNAGIISRAQYDRIVQAHQTGSVPDQYTGLGGLIEIHGFGGVGWDWTRGCIAVSDAGMDYLLERIQIGTKVIITD